MSTEPAKHTPTDRELAELPESLIEAREAYVDAVCEFRGIKYVGSWHAHIHKKACDAGDHLNEEIRAYARAAIKKATGEAA